MATFAAASWSERSIFLFYMLLWIAYSLINQFNSLHGITFDSATVVWSQEVLKIVISVGLYFVQDGGPLALWREAKENWILIFWYGIPAGLYALTDVITYVNLKSFDPATLHLLGEMKIVITAFVHQFLFKRRLNRMHWVALGVITVGCIIKAMDSMELSASRITGGDGNDDDNDGDPPIIPQPTSFNYFLILVSILMSTVAGVYNEKLLKDKPTISINLQNMCLYLDGIVFLTIGIAGGLSEHSHISEALSVSSLKELFSQPSIIVMACIMSVGGILTSRFLKVFDSIRKSVATALVVVSLPFLSRFFFGTVITAKMVLSVVLVVLGMHTYTSQPPPKMMDIPANNAVCPPSEEKEVEGFLVESIEGGCLSTTEEMELATCTQRKESNNLDKRNMHAENIRIV